MADALGARADRPEEAELGAVGVNQRQGLFGHTVHLVVRTGSMGHSRRCKQGWKRQWRRKEEVPDQQAGQPTETLGPPSWNEVNGIVANLLGGRRD
jgi:hypothetical protein